MRKINQKEKNRIIKLPPSSPSSSNGSPKASRPTVAPRPPLAATTQFHHDPLRLLCGDMPDLRGYFLGSEHAGSQRAVHRRPLPSRQRHDALRAGDHQSQHCQYFPAGFTVLADHDGFGDFCQWVCGSCQEEGF